MKTRIAHLKIKARSLMAEQQLIRSAEKSICTHRRAFRARHEGADPLYREDERLSLYWHRRQLGDSARSTHLALAFLNHTPYALAEAKTRVAPDFEEVGKLIERFGVVQEFGRSETSVEFTKRKQAQALDFANWKRAAGEHIASVQQAA